jgi:YD repeat-containing protein
MGDVSRIQLMLIPYYNTYNTLGNITSKNGVAYAYGDSNHKHAVTLVGATSYTYDANGNMQVGTARNWDVENRLTSITKDLVTTDFVYDGDGNRIKNTEGGITTLYVNKYYEKTGTEVTTSYYLGSNKTGMTSLRFTKL